MGSRREELNETINRAERAEYLEETAWKLTDGIRNFN